METIGTVDHQAPKATEPRWRLGWHRVFTPIGVFLAGFGVFNWAELPLGWKDRTEQINRYLDKTVGLGDDWVTPTLWATKSLELALGLIAVAAVVRRDPRWLVASIVGWMTLFTFMSFLAIVVVVSLANHVVRWLRARGSDERHPIEPGT